MTKKVLVLGEDTRSFLTVIRSLGKQGYLVDVVCYDKKSPSLHSKYVNRAHFLNYQAYSQTEWLSCLLELVYQENYDALFPCDERAIFPLYENQSSFPPSCQLAIPNQEVIENLFDKEKTKKIAIKCEIPVARGEILTIKDKSYGELAALFGNKFVVKPTLSFKSETLSTRQKVEIVENDEQLRAYTKHVHERDEYLIEEYFTGVGEGVSLFAVDGKVQHLFAHTRVNEPRAGGGSSYRKAIPVDAGMGEACIKLCEATRFTGVGMFEFKKNRTTGLWILIEVNARFWGSLPLAVFAGIDFPADYAKYLFNEFSPHSLPNKQYKVNAYARSLSNDIYDLKAEFEYDLKHQSTFYALGRLSKRILSFFRIFHNEQIDSYDKLDPAPFKHEVKQFWQATIGGKFKQKFTDPSDAEMQRLMRLLHIKNDISIKFICYGNIMRSPMAAKTLSILASEVDLTWAIDSYGFHQNQQRKSPDECVMGAKNIGVCLTEHRSKWLPQHEIDPEHDIIFIFDDKNMSQIESFYDCKYLFNLAHFVPRGLGKHNEIADPYGNGDEAVKYCYLLIVEAVKNFFESHLKNNS
ncbi:hypothetical protein [Glaciecola sp. MF2-115]|uniref:arsenate reductase/protein-tyrosine-phosphatase family protein n=1 Tax=Glaciecola sp. MF2-115 TaxID=3384827 RepID=UPI0039A11B90